MLKSTPNSNVPFAASCEELVELGASRDGDFIIQPNRTLEPFQVQCRFNGSDAVTVVEKTHEKQEWL